jgi:hypothetical protein
VSNRPAWYAVMNKVAAISARYAGTEGSPSTPTIRA